MSIVERALEKIQRPKGKGESPRPLAAQERPSPVDAPPTPPRGGFASPVRHSVTLDRAAFRAAGLLPPVDAERKLAEEYRRIKRPLVARSLSPDVGVDPRTRLILVTSAIAGEGKTFTSINLSLSLAIEKDIRVLLIDGDVAKRQITELFGLGNAPGLLDAIRDPAVDAEALIHDTDVPGLALLPAGARSEVDTELLASRRMAEVAERLVSSDTGRLAVLDSPPLLLTTEAREIAAVVGQIVLVVRAGHTPQQTVLDAIQVVGEGREIGLLLNQAAVRTVHESYYSYPYTSHRDHQG